MHEHAIRTVMYGIQLGLAYILMLLVMGYNGGVFFGTLPPHRHLCTSPRPRVPDASPRTECTDHTLLQLL